MSVLDGTVAKFRGGTNGFIGQTNTLVTGFTGAGGSATNIVMDNTGTPTYPAAPQTQGVWYGTGTEVSSTAAGVGAVVLGNGATVSGANTTAVGRSAVASTANSIAVGSSATTAGAGTNKVAIGSAAAASGNGAVAIGSTAAASGTAGVAIGQGTTANQDFAVCVGLTCSAANPGDVCLGTSAATVAGGAGLAIYVGDPVVVAAAGASDAYLRVRLQGTTYKILLHT